MIGNMDPLKDIFEYLRQHGDELSPWLARLADVFRTMDAGYGETAQDYGFVCRGCEDNCCRSRFYHHTLLEYLAVYRGFSRLDDRAKQQVVLRADAYRRLHAAADADGTKANPWCPLNEAGRCLIYDERPLICRLHGIPYLLHQPGGGTVQGTGCEYFESHHETGNRALLNRTPFYKAMAGLERDFRAELSVYVKNRQTIAEMIESFLPEGVEDRLGDKS